MNQAHDNSADPAQLLENSDDASRASVRGRRLGVLLPVMISLVVGAIFVFVYLSAFHQPVPHRMDVAVVGDTSTASRVVDLSAKSGEIVAREVDSVSEALDALRERRVFGVIDATSATETTLFIAGANGAAVRNDLVSMLMPIVVADGMELEVQDALPLSDGDSSGLSIFYATFGLVLAGFLFGVNTYTAAPKLPLKLRLLSVTLFAVAGGVVIALITGGLGFQAIPGGFAAVAGMVALTAGAVALVTMLTLRLAGPLGTPIAVVLMLILGNATSGGVLPFVYLPDWMLPLNWVLPVGAGVRGLQGIAYFEGSGVVLGVTVTGVWILFCIAALVVLDSRGARSLRRTAEAMDSSGAIEVRVH